MRYDARRVLRRFRGMTVGRGGYRGSESIRRLRFSSNSSLGKLVRRSYVKLAFQHETKFLVPFGPSSEGPACRVDRRLGPPGRPARYAEKPCIQWVSGAIKVSIYKPKTEKSFKGLQRKETTRNASQGFTKPSRRRDGGSLGFAAPKDVSCNCEPALRSQYRIGAVGSESGGVTPAGQSGA